MTIEEKMQVEVIKGNRIYYCDFENFVLLTDGYIGVYIPSKALKINKDSMTKMENGDSLNPDNLSKIGFSAKITKIAYKLLFNKQEYAIKIKSNENDKYCFINDKYLKLFKDSNCLYIKDDKSPVLFTRYGAPYGIVLPMNISEAALKELQQ